jgi:hypothetical protein
MRALIALLAPLALAVTAPAAAQTVTVPADHTGLVRLPQEAATIVVGNPAIADAMLYDSRTLFVSGRVFGQTNLIALNAEGRVIYAADVSVTLSDRNHVQVVRNNTTDLTSAQHTYVCDPVCRAVPVIGDEPGRFDAVAGQRNTVSGAAQSAAGAASDPAPE